jgi:tetratricopeptide (TPR) repeat protein
MSCKILVAAALACCVLAVVGPAQATGADDLAAGSAALRRQDLDAAIRLMTQALAGDDLAPAQRAYAFTARGNAYDDRGQIERALADYSEAIRAAPEFADAYLNRGVALSRRQRFAAAIADFDVAIRLKPDAADPHRQRGNALDELGRFGEAVAEYAIAIRLKPDDPQSFYDRGISYFRQAKPEQAIADYDAAIRLKPNYAKSLAERGRAELAMARYADAAADLAASLQAKPQQGFETALMLHLARARAGQDDAAEWARNGAAFAGVGLIALYQGRLRPDEVLAQATPADPPQKTPDCRTSFYVGLYYRLHEEPAKARQLLQRVAQKCPVNQMDRVSAQLELRRLAK